MSRGRRRCRGPRIRCPRTRPPRSACACRARTTDGRRSACRSRCAPDRSAGTGRPRSSRCLATPATSAAMCDSAARSRSGTDCGQRPSPRPRTVWSSRSSTARSSATRCSLRGGPPTRHGCCSTPMTSPTCCGPAATCWGPPSPRAGTGSGSASTATSASPIRGLSPWPPSCGWSTRTAGSRRWSPTPRGQPATWDPPLRPASTRARRSMPA